MTAMTTTTAMTPVNTRTEPSEHRRPGGLVGTGSRTQRDFEAHLAAYGPLPDLRPRDIVSLAAAAGLTGHGGAGFPLARKLEAVAEAAGRGVVVGNGAEGEPASKKDSWLLAHRPHLVLDGLQLAARAVGARDAILYSGDRQLSGLAGVFAQRAARGRRNADRTPVELVAAPEAFISGEESAVVNYLTSGLALPRFKVPRVTERGVRGRPTLVSNVETLALLALIARNGAEWFRSRGTVEQPGTMLCSVSGAVERPGIVEAPHGASLVDVISQAGGPSSGVQAVLLGGYHGSWLTPSEALTARLSRTDPVLVSANATPGAGVIVVLPEGACPLAEVSQVMSYLARESAAQCGPCLNGLPRIAEQTRSLAFAGRAAVREIERLSGVIAGRGACHHPDGSLRFLRSALRVFADEVALHQQGRCSVRTRESRATVLPVPSRQD